MKKRIKLLLVIIWMIFIFIMSQMDDTISSSQSGFFVNIITSIFKVNNIETLSIIIRKLAHFTEYFILGILILNLFIDSKKALFLSILICLIYAISDEVHQIFVPGRAGKIMDVMIDLFGSLIGIFILKAYKNLTKYKK